MEVEHKTVMLAVDETLQAELDKLAAEGWQNMFKPVAIYQLTRIVAPMAQASGKLSLSIDESKIGIIRNGKYIG